MESGTLKKLYVCLSFVILTWLDFVFASCYRKPQGATGDRSPVDENYQILIDGNPAAYIPGQQYNISLSSGNGLKFISFTLLLEADASATGLSPSLAVGDQLLGHFEIIDNAKTKFSNLCENMIENSNTNAKTRIDVAWMAPSSLESGCVLFKAAILQHRNVWFIDDGFLTKRLCPEEIDQINGQTPPINPCCACDEAKYEIVLERKWRRNTHAKDFPSELWRTKLGEVVGASHSLDFRFWKYGGRASQGLQELAEHGATKTLENEIIQHTRTGDIRTIIKAPGIKYHPNIIGKTLATVRVGPNHHLISLVLKVDPSPDWILGVSGLELCLANCTWIEKKVLNLYPWDVGTDAGPSYMSPDQAQYPPDVIRRISSSFPSDHRSPFFDKTGAPMKPLATLHVNRKRTYERECNFEESTALECSTHPWSNWTECSAKCGAGTQYRLRFYKDPKVAENFNCNLVMRQNQDCVGMQCGVQQTDVVSAECELTNWSAWSECSKKCGKGFQTRTRDYSNPYAREKCQAGVNVELQQTRTCSGENCGGNILNPSYDTNDNGMFDPNFGEQEAEQNLFKHPNFDRKPYGKGQQNTNWRPTETEAEQSNYDGLNNNMNFNYDKSDSRSRNPGQFSNSHNEEYKGTGNIYGNEKLVGVTTRRPYERDQYENTNLFGDLEPNFSDTRREGYNEFSYKDKNNLRQRPGFNNSPNKFYNTRDPYGYKNIESKETGQQQKTQFCFEKPIASTTRCPELKNYWFYDADDDECKLFTADICDKNRNKFRSLEKCTEACAQGTMAENRDTMSINRGRYNSKGFKGTQQPPFLSRWN